MPDHVHLLIEMQDDTISRIVQRVLTSFSASYPASAAIDGDRKGTNWGNGGGWMDGTCEEFPD